MFNVKSLIFRIIALIWLLPFLFLPIWSLAESWVFPAIFPLSFTLRHWQEFFENSNGLFSSLLHSLWLAFSVASFATFSGFVIAKSIAYHPWRRTWIRLAYLPYILSPVIYAVCLQFYFVWFGLSGTWMGILIAQFILIFPYSILFFVDYWSERMQNYEQLVATLGGSRWQKYVYILIPMSKNILGLCFFQCFLISWFEFGLTNFIGVGKIQTLTIKVYQFTQEANPYLAALASCVLIFPPIILLWVSKYQLRINNYKL